jgi:glucan phosphoethanolaminetransferase (alkaline phosphatase superfamily)
LIAVVLLFLSRKVVRPKRARVQVASLLVPFILVGSLLLPTHYKHRQPSSPDILYMNAMGSMLETQLGFSRESHQVRPRARKSHVVPRLTPRPARPRNVVFVILESVRKDATCNEFDPACRRTEATNQLFPGRFPLNQMRALDSSTAISMAVLWAGIGPHESREVMHTWPLVFDYARQAGYSTAYWTSQSMMFGNMRLWLQNLGVDSFVTATDVDPASDIDLGAPENLFAERAIQELGRLKEPFMVTIQLSNGHYPYLVAEDGPQPFQPATRSKAPDENHAFFNHYQNAIHQQDLHLAKVLGAFWDSSFGKNTVIVYTSDHGEAFREHHQMGHTFSIFDEEVLVPAWIFAPPGTLSEEEQEHLSQKRDAFTFHPDLTATVLDLLGVWDDPALARFQERMLGVSLLRKPVNERALPMTNCAAVWSCAFENWGYMRKEMKLEARAWDHEYHCWDVRLDPAESVNLGTKACGDLEQRANETFRRLPGK